MDYQDNCDATSGQQPLRGYDSNSYPWAGNSATLPTSIGSYGYTAPATLQYTIDTYKREFGKNWMYYFKATVKVTL